MQNIWANSKGKLPSIPIQRSRRYRAMNSKRSLHRMLDLLIQIQSFPCCSLDVQGLALTAQKVKDSKQIMPKQEAAVEVIQILAYSHSRSSQSEELELKMKVKFYTRYYQMNLLIWQDSIYRYLVCMSDINTIISQHETSTICQLPATRPVSRI